MLEPYEAKVSRTVLRREGASNCSFLFGTVLPNTLTSEQKVIFSH
ncbi:Uncharacterised protein [uncultured archaeon]|nr:Uncharacterised protein [uncultured archaeon]